MAHHCILYVSLRQTPSQKVSGSEMSPKTKLPLLIHFKTSRLHM